MKKPGERERADVATAQRLLNERRNDAHREAHEGYYTRRLQEIRSRFDLGQARANFSENWQGLDTSGCPGVLAEIDAYLAQRQGGRQPAPQAQADTGNTILWGMDPLQPEVSYSQTTYVDYGQHAPWPAARPAPREAPSGLSAEQKRAIEADNARRAWLVAQLPAEARQVYDLAQNMIAAGRQEDAGRLVQNFINTEKWKREMQEFPILVMSEKAEGRSR